MRRNPRQRGLKKHRIKVNDPYKVILYPWFSEKTMRHIAQNKLEFVVSKKATKPQIKKAIEEIYQVKVTKVNTRNMKDGKRAIVTLSKEYSAEDVSMAIGII
ncbi:MAG TPA: 50S ribosomal protein L23 [Thermoplasmata archaeon]|nr:50S ribosomal protein L23 [Thermoplasmata archaeon]